MAELHNSQRCTCKVGRDIDAYDLSDLNHELIERYLDDGASLRDLATYVNRRILDAALERTDAAVFDSDRELFGVLDREQAVAAIYEVLATDDVPADRRARVQTQLYQTGVDPDAIMDDWVSHTTVRRHLRECLDIDTGATSGIDPTDAMNTLEWARSRCKGVVERLLQRLQASDAVRITAPDITVSIRITCTKCQESYRPSELTSIDRCGCTRSEGTADPVNSS